MATFEICYYAYVNMRSIHIAQPNGSMDVLSDRMEHCREVQIKIYSTFDIAYSTQTYAYGHGVINRSHLNLAGYFQDQPRRYQSCTNDSHRVAAASPAVTGREPPCRALTLPSRRPWSRLVRLPLWRPTSPIRYSARYVAAATSRSATSFSFATVSFRQGYPIQGYPTQGSARVMARSAAARTTSVASRRVHSVGCAASSRSLHWPNGSVRCVMQQTHAASGAVATTQAHGACRGLGGVFRWTRCRARAEARVWDWLMTLLTMDLMTVLLESQTIGSQSLQSMSRHARV